MSAWTSTALDQWMVCFLMLLCSVKNALLQESSDWFPLAVEMFECINSCVTQWDFFQCSPHHPPLLKSSVFIMLKWFFLKIMAWQNPQWQFKWLCLFFSPPSSLLVCHPQCEVLKLTQTHGEFTTQDFGPHASDFSSNRSISWWVRALRKSAKITIITIKDNGKSLAKGLLRARVSDWGDLKEGF